MLRLLCWFGFHNWALEVVTFTWEGKAVPGDLVCLRCKKRVKVDG